MSTKHLFVSIHIRNKSEAGAVKYVLSLQYFFTDGSKAVLLSWIFFLLFVFHVCRADLSITCSHLLRKGLPLGSFVCDVFLRFFTFLYSVLGQVWYLILSI